MNTNFVELSVAEMETIDGGGAFQTVMYYGFVGGTGAIGGVIGSAVGGPIGGAIGARAGAVAGGMAGAYVGDKIWNRSH